jgi:hypothetical protein
MSYRKSRRRQLIKPSFIIHLERQSIGKEVDLDILVTSMVNIGPCYACKGDPPSAWQRINA